MDRCIYLYKKRSNLTYDGEEHIIPAGLGGIKKLPKGYVSDEANNLFSKMELKALRYSFLAGNRLRHGPGKRGNQKLNKEKTPVIRLLNDQDSNQLKLGYIFMGSVYLIPQILCNFKFLSGEMKCDLFGDDYENDDFPGYFNTFKTELVKFLLDPKRKFTFLENDEKSNSSVYIGIYKNKWYISSNFHSFNLDNYIEIIINYFIAEAIDSSEKENNKIIHNMNRSEFKYCYPIDITDTSFYYLFLKIAFNSLAYLLGQETALSSSFDNIRQDIINCENINKYLIPERSFKEFLKKYTRNFKNNEHYVFIFSKETSLYAYVSLYNEWYSCMILSDNFQGEPVMTGFICDWKSKKEYTYSHNL